MLAVELRPEETRGPLEDLVGPAELAVFLLQLTRPSALARGHPRRATIVDVGLPHPQADRLGPASELGRDPLDRPVLGSELRAQARTIRTAEAFSSSEYRRVVGFPFDTSRGMAPSSFPRSGTSNIPRATQPQTASWPRPTTEQRNDLRTRQPRTWERAS